VVAIAQGDIFWADLPPPVGSTAGFRRPVVVVQGDAVNRSRLATVIIVPLTSNLRWADVLGNVRLAARSTGLAKDSVANVSLVAAIDRSLLRERVGHVGRTLLERIFSGVDVVLGR
jgi:mRNA interferase MazF